MGMPPDLTIASIAGRGANAALRSLITLVASASVSAGNAILGRK